MGAYRDENKTAFGTASSVMRIEKAKSYIRKKRIFYQKRSIKLGKEFLSQQAGIVEMTFREFFELYKRDKKLRIIENTWRTKEV